MNDYLFWSLIGGAFLIAGLCLAYIIGGATKLGGPEDPRVVTLPPGNYRDRAEMMAALRKSQARAARRGR